MIQLLMSEYGFQAFIETVELSHLFRSFDTGESCFILLFMLLEVIIMITVVPINIS